MGPPEAACISACKTFGGTLLNTDPALFGALPFDVEEVGDVGVTSVELQLDAITAIAIKATKVQNNRDGVQNVLVTC